MKVESKWKRKRGRPLNGLLSPMRLEEICIGVNAPIAIERDAERETLDLLLRLLNAGQGKKLLVWLRRQESLIREVEIVAQCQIQSPSKSTRRPSLSKRSTEDDVCKCKDAATTALNSEAPPPAPIPSATLYL